MIKKLKQGVGKIWQAIKRVDFEHFGVHFDNYTRLLLSILGVTVFGAIAFMEYCYLPVLQAQVNTVPMQVKGDPLGALFKIWPMLSWYISVVIFTTGIAWSLFEFGKSFSFWDFHHRRILELRARINDVECGVEGDGRSNEWLQGLKFEDSDEARKVANFVFLGKRLNFKAKRVKEIVEAKFGKD